MDMTQNRWTLQKSDLLKITVNSLRPRSRHKYTKYKMCLSMMMLVCIKQHLSKI